MKIKNAISAIERAGGRVEKHGAFFVGIFAGKRRRIVFHENGGDYSDSVATINVRREDDHDDPQADYSAGIFMDTMKQAIDAVRRW